MAYADCKTKIAKVDYMKAQLQNNDLWMLKGLITIYQHQTQEEQTAKVTKEHNGVGFTGIDGEILTSFATQAINKGVMPLISANCKTIYAERFFSKPQIDILKRKMPKYAQQLVRLSESKHVAA